MGSEEADAVRRLGGRVCGPRYEDCDLRWAYGNPNSNVACAYCHALYSVPESYWDQDSTELDQPRLIRQGNPLRKENAEP